MRDDALLACVANLRVAIEEQSVAEVELVGDTESDAAADHAFAMFDGTLNWPTLLD